MIDNLKVNIFNPRNNGFRKLSAAKLNLSPDKFRRCSVAVEIHNANSEIIDKISCEKNRPDIHIKDDYILIADHSSNTDNICKYIQQCGLDSLAEKIKGIQNKINNYDSLVIQAGEKKLPSTRAVVMGILNVTPDSFSDGGKYLNREAALLHAEKMIADGADIIDIGGESTRPGAMPVTPEEEMERVIPVIELLKTKHPDLIISIDTTKADVAEAAVKAGAAIINDISGMTFDKRMPETAAVSGASLILMHMQGKPRTMQKNPRYENLISDIYFFLEERIKLAREFGISQIIIDPGIGFGKSVKDNLEIIHRLGDFKGLGFPILMGLSRKSFIGKTMNLEVENRDIATITAETAAIMNGAKIIRTHNVKNARQAAVMTGLIRNPERWTDV